MAILALTALLVAPGALAQPQDPGPPGNNGTVKIHEGMDHSDPPPTDRNHEPHVCDFHIHGFNFDSMESGVWRIYEWSPTGERQLVDSGSWTADEDGEWMSGLKTLPDGHYRLVWEIPGDGNDDKDGDTTADKHKMFWVECEGGEVPATPTPTATGTEAAATPTPTATGTEAAATPTPTMTATATATATGEELPATATPTAPAPGETPTATATGGELPAIGTPTPPTGGEVPAPAVTPPETAAEDPDGAAGGAPIGLVMLLMGAGVAGLLLLTPAPRRTRR